MTRPEPTFVVERITPRLAKTYLAANRQNRPLSAKVVRMYTQAIKRGEWMMNAEAIKFDWHGQLVDGQHRLAAVLRADRAVEFLVARNLSPDAFRTIDTGKLRSPSDIIALRGVTRYHHAIATAYRMLWRYVHADRSKHRISNTQLCALMDDHPALVQRAYEVMKAPLYIGACVPQSAQVFAYYCMAQIDWDRAREFFGAVAQGQADTPPIMAALHRRLMDTHREIIKPSPTVKLAWVVDSWNRWLAGAGVERLSRTITEVPRFTPEPFERKDVSGKHRLS